MICSRPLTNSARLRHRQSMVYANATRCGSREFQPFSAPRTLRIAVSRVNGGTNFTGAGVGELPTPVPGLDALKIRESREASLSICLSPYPCLLRGLLRH